MKKFFSFCLMGVMALMMASCGDGNDPANSKLFTFEVQSKSATGFVCYVKPTNPETLYATIVLLPEKMIDANGNKLTPQQAVEAYWNSGDGLDYNDDYLDYLARVNPNKKIEMKDLQPDTEYVIAVYQVSPDNKTTVLAYTTIKTEAN